MTETFVIRNPCEAVDLTNPIIQPSQAFSLVQEFGVQPCILPILFPQSIPVQRQLFICGDFRRSLPHHFIYSSPPPGIRLLLQPSKMLLQIPVHSLPQLIRSTADGNAIRVNTETICICTKEEDVNEPAPRHIAI